MLSRFRGLRWRLLAPSLLVAAFAVVALSIAVTGFSDVEDEVSVMVENDSASISLLLNLDRDSYQAQLAVERGVAAAGTDRVEGFLADYVENRDQVSDRFGQYEERSLEREGEADLQAAFWTLHDEWVAVTDDLAALLATGTDHDDPRVVETLARSQTVYDAFRLTIDEIQVQVYEPALEAFGPRLSSSIDGARTRTVGAMAAGLVLAFLMVGLVVRSIRRSVTSIVERSAKVALGDLDVEVRDVEGTDELARLEQAWADVVAYLRGYAGIVTRVADGDLTVEVAPRSDADVLGHSLAGMVSGIDGLITENRNLAESALTGAGELNRSSEDSARFAAEVATSITGVAESASRQVEISERLAEAVQRIAAHVDSSIESSESMIGATDEARSTASEGSRLMADVEEAIRQVTGSFSHVEDSVRSLDGQFAQVEEVVELIRSIADQTNLLALNAAIEAARAGELGRGFAVVASEVKTLAEESARSTERIGTIVGAVRSEVSRTVDVTRRGRSEVDRTAEVVGSSGQAFASIETSITGVDEHARRVAAHTADIRTVAADIEDATGELVSISHSTGAAAEEVAAASEESAATAHDIGSSAEGLVGLAGQIKAAIGRFRTTTG